MTNEKLISLLSEFFAENEIQIGGDGHHFDAYIVSEKFQGKSLIERQRMVYALLNPYIQSGELHAISMKLKTPNELI